MKIRIRNQQDFFAALILLAVGIGAILAGLRYDITGFRRVMATSGMGPGYFPFALGLSLILTGVVVAVKALIVDGPLVVHQSIRPPLILIAAILAFAFLLPRVGLIITAFLTVLASSLGWHEFRWRKSVILALFLTILSVGIFVLGLKLPLKIWPV